MTIVTLKPENSGKRRNEELLPFKQESVAKRKDGRNENAACISENPIEGTRAQAFLCC